MYIRFFMRIFALEMKDGNILNIKLGTKNENQGKVLWNGACKTFFKVLVLIQGLSSTGDIIHSKKKPIV
ncbi:MAG: hypothetical protein IKP91_07165 [Bacteroidaceae bacterium]|nr:hypothetical protein [Bacteroidaceae bacterium]